MAFERIVYAGDYCEELSGISCEFVPGEDRPTIQSLCKIAAQMGTWVAILNSDIVVSKSMAELEQRMDCVGAKCGITRRYDLDSGWIIDWGLDFFCGTQEVWAKAYRTIPKDFTLSRGQWDQWMKNFMVAEFGRKCCDLTRERFCFHKEHGDRLDPNWNGPGLDHKYSKIHYWPSTILR